MTHSLSNTSKIDRKNLAYLPMKILLDKSKDSIIIDWYKESDRDQTYAILKHIVDEGQAYPFLKFDESDFEKFYLALDIIVARCAETGSVLGTFYIRSYFPGRSSHIANGGFGIREDQRRKGIGEILYKIYLRIARDFGYEGSLFNLIYTCNVGSVKLCRRLGFTEVCLIPKAGKLKDLGYCDAVQFYYDLTALNDVGEPPCGWLKHS